MEGSEEQKIPSDHENVNFRNQDPAFFTDVVGGGKYLYLSFIFG